MNNFEVDIRHLSEAEGDCRRFALFNATLSAADVVSTDQLTQEYCEMVLYDACKLNHYIDDNGYVAFMATVYFAVASAAAESRVRLGYLQKLKDLDAQTLQ